MTNKKTWKPMDGLSSLERTLLNVGKNEYKSNIRIEATDKEINRKYLLSTKINDSKLPFPTYTVTLYRSAEVGWDVIESYKINNGSIVLNKPPIK